MDTVAKSNRKLVLFHQSWFSISALFLKISRRFPLNSLWRHQHRGWLQLIWTFGNNSAHQTPTTCTDLSGSFGLKLFKSYWSASRRQRPYLPPHLHICPTWLQMPGLMLAAPGGRCNWPVWGQTARTAPPYKPTLSTGLQIPTRHSWDSDRTAADLRVPALTSCLRLSLRPDASIQLCPTCPAPPAAAGPDLQRRVAWQKQEGKRNCQFGTRLTPLWFLTRTFGTKTFQRM